MRASSESMIVLGALLLAVLMAGQESRNEWKVTYSRTPGMVNFGIQRTSPGNRNSYSSDVPLSAFRGLNPGQSGPAKFEYIADAGTFVCQGRFSFGAGSGSYTFQANPRFVDRLAATRLRYAARGPTLQHGRNADHAGFRPRHS